MAGNKGILEHYISQFSSLKRAPGKVWTDATKKKAPHKPVLLLALLDLVHRGGVPSSFIDINSDLIELTELFNHYWRRIVPLGQSSSIAFPFSRLSREPFWALLSTTGQEISPADINNTSSVSYLRKYAIGAKIDDDLFLLLQGEDNRSVLREHLLQACFSEASQGLLREQSILNREVFDYSKVIEEKAHQHSVHERKEQDDYSSFVRDQAFRRIVVKVYDHRCALCGIRIVTPEQHTAVDAAHIIPWSISHNDNVDNGMALCKLCHWAFDKGMMGVSKDYDVIVSKQVMLEPNAPGFLMTLEGRRIISPENSAMWPSQENLKQHRRDWRL